MTPTKQDVERIKKAVKQVVRNRGQKTAVRDLSHYFQRKLMTPGIKETFVHQLDAVIEGKVRPDPSAMFISMMTMSPVSTKLELTDHQRGCLKSIRKIIKDAKEDECDHKLVIVPFFHGGGFSPIHVLPELVCHVCGLNVTIQLHMSTESLIKSRGIELPHRLKKTLQDWCRWADQDRETEVLSAREISKDLKRALDKSTQFYGDFSMMKVVNKEKLESMSGR